MNIALSDLSRLPSPLERVDFNYLDESYELYVKRDDLIHFVVGGNKWRKLMGHEVFREVGKKYSIVSTGGNYSNLVFALSYICYVYGYPLTILSPETETETYMMKWCRKLGTVFVGVSRSKLRAIRNGDLSPLNLLEIDENVVWIPEGGGGEWSDSGIKSIIDELGFQAPNKDLVLLTAAGTGVTAFQLANFLPIQWDLVVFPAIKSPSFIEFMEKGLIHSDRKAGTSLLLTQHTDKGIGQVHEDLVDFLLGFYNQNGILLDPFYNGKALYYTIKNEHFKKNDKSIVLIHSGGAQAWVGLGNRYPYDRRIRVLAEVFMKQFRNENELGFDQ